MDCIYECGYFIHELRSRLPSGLMIKRMFYLVLRESRRIFHEFVVDLKQVGGSP